MSRTKSELSRRIREGLENARLHGRVGGNPDLKEARAQALAAITNNANSYAEELKPVIMALQNAGHHSFSSLAAALNQQGVPTARGGKWHPMTVKNILSRLNLA